jgi:hypothetical protein
VRERGPFKNVPKEEFPLGFECIVENLVIRHLAPICEEVMGVGQIGIPDGQRRTNSRLNFAVAKAGHCAALSSIDLERK